MKNKCCSLAACLFLLPIGSGLALAQTGTHQTGNYEALVQRVEEGDQTVDFRRLRVSYMDSDTYRKSPDTSSQKKAMTLALNAKDFKEAMKNADTVLDSDYVDLDAHFTAFIANRELGNIEKAEFHKYVFQSLLKSITDSGDGKTPETAFQVIQVHEEYVLLQVMGAGLPESQSLLKKSGHSYDQIRFKDPKTGEPVTVYFNVDIPAKHGL